MSKKYKLANKFLTRLCLNYLLKCSKNITGNGRRLVREDLEYIYYKFGLHEYWRKKMTDKEELASNTIYRNRQEKSFLISP